MRIPAAADIAQLDRQAIEDDVAPYRGMRSREVGIDGFRLLLGGAAGATARYPA